MQGCLCVRHPQAVPRQKPMQTKVIDDSVEPGVDITDHYFVLWEPFLRAKAALLVGAIAQRCETLPDCASRVDRLVGIFANPQSEEFECLCNHEYRPAPAEAVLPHFPHIAKPATSLTSIAAAPPKAFGLFHSSLSLISATSRESSRTRIM